MRDYDSAGIRNIAVVGHGASGKTSLVDAFCFAAGSGKPADDLLVDRAGQHHLGNVGELVPGGVQWMTAGRGVIHSEMPLQESGRMRGFQLWLNLPAREKMQPAWYRDIPASELPVTALPGGGQLKLIAGSVMVDGQPLDGPINGPAKRLSTDPLYLDLDLPAGSRHVQAVPMGHNAFVYAYEGSVTIGDGAACLGATGGRAAAGRCGHAARRGWHWPGNGHPGESTRAARHRPSRREGCPRGVAARRSARCRSIPRGRGQTPR